MVEMGEMVSMKFKGEYPSVDLLCRRTIQRCKDDAAESKERKLAEAKRATDATLERVGSLRIGGSASKDTVKSPARVKPRLSAEDQEGDDRPVTADSALSLDSERPDSSTSSRASQGRSPRGLLPTRSLDDDNMKQWLANKKLKEEERSKLKKAGSQKDLRWMKQLSAKQLVRNKSLRKEEEEAAKAKIAAMGGRDPVAEREAALEALAKQEEAETSRANSPAERPPTVEEAAARLFGNL